MAWTEMSYYKYSQDRNKEIIRRDYEYNDYEFSYGLLEDITKKNCYGVETVYDDLNDWN